MIQPLDKIIEDFIPDPLDFQSLKSKYAFHTRFRKPIEFYDSRRRTDSTNMGSLAISDLVDLTY
jgi:hypothetical protein